MGQVNFRTTDDVQERWTALKSEVDLKNDDLFAAMLSAYEESRGVKAGGHAAELAEIQETLTTAVSQMVALLGKDEARRKASVMSIEAERVELAQKLAAERERTEELQRKLADAEQELDELRARAEESDRIADLAAKIDALALAKAE